MPRPGAGSRGTGGGPKKKDGDKKADERRKKQMQGMKDKMKGDRAGGPDPAAAFAAEEVGDSNMMTRLQTPEWVELVLAVTRISELQFRIQEEREERSKDTYQNPYSELFNVVSSLRFEIAIAVFIFLNGVMIGLEASWPDDSAQPIFEGIEHFFVFFFFGEWCLRVRAFGWVWIFEWGNAADSFLVFGTGVFPKWILEPLGFSVGSLRILTVLRTLRLVRLVRAVRLMPQFKELWMLICGLIESARPLLWTAVIAMMILYIFGVAATELIGRQSLFRDDEYAQELFGDPLRSMFTLFQLMTMDTWGYTIARPIMEKDWWLSLFFVFFIMIGVFVFWNLITAIIVENAMNIANEDTQQKAKDLEMQKKQELKVLAEIFLEIDADGSGELSTEEFFGALENPRVKQLIDLLDLKPEDMEEVWNVLDDGDGVLTVKEFTTGLRRMKGEAKSKDISDILKRLRHTSLHHTDLRAQVDRFNHTLGALEHDVERIQSDTGEVLGMFQEMYHRLQAHVEREAGEDRLLAIKRRKLRELEEEAEAAEEAAAAGEDDESGASPLFPDSPSSAASP